MGNRNYSDTGTTTDLEFQLLQNNQAFDASSVRQVVIYPTYLDAQNGTNAIQTITAITKIGTGLYLYTAALIATAGTYYDKIFITPSAGGLELSFINSFIITQYSSGLTAVDVRDYLEGYGVTSAQLSDNWINGRLNNFVIPFVEEYTRQSFSGIKTVTEYHDGAGESILFLDRRPINEVTNIRYVTGGDYQVILDLAMIETIAAEGILKAKVNLLESTACFPYFVKGNRNIMVTYTYGYDTYPSDIKEAITCLASVMCLNFIGARLGGGNSNLQGISKTYGDRGKYTDIIVQLERYAYMLMNKYRTSVIGS